MPSTPTLVVDALNLSDLNGRSIVRDVSLSVNVGEVLAIIGESGSGKTSLALGLMGFARPGMRIGSGRVIIDGRDVLSLPAEELRAYRGNKITNVPQNPTASFSPRMRIGTQIREVLEAHGRDQSQCHSLIENALESVSLPNNEAFLKRYPFELSGGQLQRVAIAVAFITGPRVVVMDEPTTGLDVSTQQTILELIRKLVQTSEASFVYVTHDLAVVHSVADRVAVMYRGDVVETGTREQIFKAARHDYTRMLLKSIPRLQHTSTSPEAVVPQRPPSAAPLLSLQNMQASHGELKAVNGLSFDIAQGQCVGLIGGSGSGKTTTGRAITGLHTKVEGKLLFEGRQLPWRVRDRSKADLRAIQIVFQNPDRSLNPRESISQCVRRAVCLDASLAPDVVEGHVSRLLDRVRLPKRTWSLYPDDLSGGERQRVAVARALATRPKLMICDEITSALDVSIQASVIELLLELKMDGLSMLFITHNLPLVSDIAETLVILKDGNMVETGETSAVLFNPQHDYTKALLASALQLRA